MLSLFVNDKSLDLTSDVSITLKFTSPIFNTIADHSYPFKIPCTPNNIALLGYKHRIENSNDQHQTFNASLEWNGVFLLNGLLRILSANDQFYEATLYMDKGDFFYRRKSMTLQDIDFLSMKWPSCEDRLAYMNDCRNYCYPGRVMSFPTILNKEYYTILSGWPELWYLNLYIDGLLPLLWGPYHHHKQIPMLYLRYVLERIFTSLDYEVDDRFFSIDPELNSLALYNSVEVYENLIPDFGEPLPFGILDDEIMMNYHVPRITMNDFFSGLENMFNLRLFINNKSRTIKILSVDKIIKSNDSIPFSSNVNSMTTQIAEPLKGFHLKMEMDTADELWLLASKSQEKLIENIKTPVDSLSELPLWPSSPNDEIKYVRKENQYYRMVNRAWEPFSFSALPYILSSEYIHFENDKELDSKFSTLMKDTVTPFHAVVGAAKANWSTVTPKLFFTKLHPWGGSGPNDEYVSASNETDTQSLFYPGEKGLFEKHFKAYFDFLLSAKQVKFIKQMSLLELNQLDFSSKYEINGNLFLLSEVQVTMTHAGIKPASIIAYCSI